MTETKNKKKKKKVSISEDDTSLILQRYTATTILALLQEVAQFAGVKIDWNALVKKSSTGISNAREYQMLWRHLAYRDALSEKVEDGIEPLDDDSDLEIELEPSPAVNSEASIEAAACVKVLIASGSSCDSGPTNRATVEAPLTINIPNGQSLRNPSENSQLARSIQGTNITVPVSVQKQPLPSVPSSEGLDGNGSSSGNVPPRRKRKLWTAEEDMELIAAVQKFGEGNWANILKGDFKHDRTASQLSQRWAIIRKRKANLTTSNAGNSTGTVLTEAQLAARQAVSMALNMPMMGSLSAACSAAAANPSSTHNNVFTVPASASDAAPASTCPQESSTKAPMGSSSQALQQSQQTPNHASLPRGPLTSNPAPASASTSSSAPPPAAPKSRATAKRQSAPAKSPPMGPNSMIQAAAVAAGARIANPSTAASLFKAAQSKNVVHIRQGGSVPTSSLPGVARPLGPNSIGPRPSNVHYIRTGLASTAPTYSGMVPSGPRPSSQYVQSGSLKLAVTGQPPMLGTTPLNPPAQQVIAESKSATSNCGNTDSVKSPSISVSVAGSCPITSASEVKTSEDKKLDSSMEAPKESVRDQSCLPNSKADGCEAGAAAGESQTSVPRKTDVVNKSPCQNSIAIEKPTDGDVANTCSGENQTVSGKTGEDQTVTEKTTGLPSKASQNQNAFEQQRKDSSIAEATEKLATISESWGDQNVRDDKSSSLSAGVM